MREKQRQVREPTKPGDYDDGGRGWTRRLGPTGVLSFAIETHLLGRARRQWQDTEGRSLETYVTDILASLATLPPLLLERKREREEAERRRREEEAIRYQEAERKRPDDNCWKRFAELAHQSRQAAGSRRFLDGIEQQVGAGDQVAGEISLASLIAWARARLDQEDPLPAGPAKVFQDVLKATSWGYRR